MPVRLLNSRVFKWPDATRVAQAAREWAGRIAAAREDVKRIGYYGSYARGDWGVGSDLDLVMVVEDSHLPFERRSAEWDRSDLPVPSDLIVYTQREWTLLDAESRFGRVMRSETVWVYVEP